MLYEAESWLPTEDCVECIEAWTVTRGWEFVEVDVDGACGDEGWTGLEGSSLSVGHDGDEAWADLGGGWQVMEDALVENEGEWLWFEIWFRD